MSKTEARSEATYARHLLRIIFEAETPQDLDEIANELVACVTQIAVELNAPSYRY